MPNMEPSYHSVTTKGRPSRRASPSGHQGKLLGNTIRLSTKGKQIFEEFDEYYDIKH
jgi:hypothetical protein